jgi:hypothetical protein
MVWFLLGRQVGVLGGAQALGAGGALQGGWSRAGDAGSLDLRRSGSEQCRQKWQPAYPVEGDGYKSGYRSPSARKKT